MDNFVKGKFPKILVKTPSKLLKSLLRYKVSKIGTSNVSLNHMAKLSFMLLTSSTHFESAA